MADGRFRQGGHWGVTVVHDPEPGEDTGELWATAQKQEWAAEIVAALNRSADDKPIWHGSDLVADAGLNHVSEGTRVEVFKAFDAAVPVVDSELRDRVARAIFDDAKDCGANPFSLTWDDLKSEKHRDQWLSRADAALAAIAPALKKEYLDGHDSGYAAANVGDPWAGKKIAADSDLQHEIVRSLWDAADICLTDSQLTVMADAVIADVVAPVLAAQDERVAVLREEVSQQTRNWDAARNANMTALETIGGLEADLKSRRAGVAAALGFGPNAFGWDELLGRITRMRAEMAGLKARAVILPADVAVRIVETVTGAISCGLSVRQEVNDLLAIWTAQAMPDTEAPASPRVWQDGDPEPDNVRRVRDRHGDIWTRNYGGFWESPDTMPCAWWYIAKKWAPLTEVFLDGTQ